MQLNECINFLLSTAQKKVNQYFTEKIAICDVTPVQYAVLNCLWNNDYLAPSQISQELSMDSSSITGLLDRMENKGLVKRVPHAEDRRALHVMLTPLGKSLKKVVIPLISEAHSEVLSSFSDDEQVLLISLLQRLTESMVSSKKTA